MTTATLLIALVATLPTDLGGSREPIMLDFTAAWCGPCRQMRPVVEALVEKGYPIKPVDVDTSPELAEKYQVTGVPAFIVIDPQTGRELARTEGARPASELASLYQEARAKNATRPRTRPEPPAEESDDDRAAEPARDVQAASPPETSPNPKPWQTVVRIKVHGNGSIGFGSGTMISSTPQETLILTCAHIFKLENGPTPPPSRFPRKITVDLFDGKLSGMRPAQVHYSNETFEGEAVDYDFNRDVGLIRIRPGRRLPFAKVVPPHWKPKANMGMVTVGCSEGHDATAWSTVVVNPNMKGLNGNRTYEAIECMIAPKQGRSGGGLFTSDGYIAGVCDFAEPQGNHGLYAAPSSIYKILDRNDMVALYAPPRDRPRAALAENRATPAQGRPEPEYRMQSPDRNDPGGVSLPPPGMLGIKTPALAQNDAPATPARPRRGAWHPTPSRTARTAELKMDPSADTDRFATAGPLAEPEAGVQSEETPAQTRIVRAARRPSAGGWHAGKAPLPEFSAAGDR